jgi:hypothetical protein
VTYETRAFHALAHDFRVVAESQDLGRYVETVFSGLPISEAGDVATYSLARAARDDARDVVELRRGAEVVLSDPSAGALVASFVHHVNRLAISGDHAVMCHAGGVQLDDLGFVFPAHMESGKTTLTAGLVRAGFSYLTDEAVAIDPTTGLVEPYPKPLSIDAGSHFLFPELEPPPAPGDEAAPAHQWQVPPDAIRAGAVGSSCRVRFVVFPAYVEGATTALEPLSRASALLELATNTFEFRDHPRRSLVTLAAVIEGARAYRLTVGDLGDACDLVAALTDTVEART